MTDLAAGLPGGPLPVGEPVSATLPSTGSERRRHAVTAALALTASVLVVVVARSVHPGTGLLVVVAAVALVLSYVAVAAAGRAVWGAGFDTALWLSVAWVVLLVGATALASWLPLDSPTSPDFANIEQRPHLSVHQPLGTDDLGRSLLSRVIHGGRISLGIAATAAIIGAVIGGSIGLVSGYRRGTFDAVTTLCADVMLSFPPLILLLGAVTVMPKNATTIALSLGVLMIPTTFRITRANTMSLATRDFVYAARCLGARPRRIVVRELLPNVARPVLAYVFVVLGLIVVAEGSLSYLGVGVQPPTPTWGRMIADAQPSFTEAPHMVFVPSAVMFVTLISLNQIGDRLRETRGRESAI